MQGVLHDELNERFGNSSVEPSTHVLVALGCRPSRRRRRFLEAKLYLGIWKSAERGMSRVDLWRPVCVPVGIVRNLYYISAS